MANILTFGEWEFRVDRPATMEAYGLVERGGSDTCECRKCRNFALVRDQVFPAEFLALLESWGIDYRKDGEAYHMGRLTHGAHCYGGWFHFIGSLEKTGDFAAIPMGEGFTVWLCRAGAPPIPSLKGLSLVQVEFKADQVPWMLKEPEPE